MCLEFKRVYLEIKPRYKFPGYSYQDSNLVRGMVKFIF